MVGVYSFCYVYISLCKYLHKYESPYLMLKFVLRILENVQCFFAISRLFLSN